MVKKVSLEIHRLVELNSINIFVQDLEESIKFYKLLGFKFEAERKENYYHKGRIPGLTLAFYTKNVLNSFMKDKTNLEVTGYPFSIAIRVDQGGVDKTYEKIKENGYQEFREPQDTSWGQRVAFLLDPDNNLIEINALI